MMDEYPTYRSPIRLLHELGLNASDINEDSLKLERKRLLLEIQISSDDTIQIGDKAFTKNDVIKVFEELFSITDLAFHERIFDHPILLDLLENHLISESEEDVQSLHLNFNSDEERQQFTHFISPFLANSLDKLLSKTVRSSSYDRFVIVLPFFKLLHEVDAVFAFRKFYAFCRTMDQRLDTAALNNSVFPFDEFKYLTEEPFYTIINEANNYFSDLADGIGQTLANFSIDQQYSKARANHLLKLYNQLRGLKCDAELKSVIVTNRKEFRKLRLVSVFGLFRMPWKYLRVVIILVTWFILGGIFGDDSPRVEESKEEKYVNAYKELDLKVAAFKQQSVLNKNSPVRKSNFDTTAFRIFHDSAYARVTQRRFTTNTVVRNSLPKIHSPLRIIDSANLIPFGKKVSIRNITDSDMFMVIRDRNVLSSHFIASNSRLPIAIDPGSSVFFYSGNDWDTSQIMVYSYPFEHLTEKNIDMIFSGTFKQTSENNLRFMETIYYLRQGSQTDLSIEERDGNYVFLQSDNRFMIRPGFSDIDY